MAEYTYEIVPVGGDAFVPPPAPVEGVFTYDPNHVATAIGRLIEFFRNGPRNQAWLAATVGQVQDAEDGAATVVPAFDINTATGVQLDVAGALVGEPRVGRTDDDYRAAIRVAVLVNNSTGSTGDLDNIGTKLVPEAHVFVQQIATGIIQVNFSTTGAVSTYTILRSMQRAKAAGIRIGVVWGELMGSIDGDPIGGEIGSADGDPLGMVIGSGT